MTHSALKVVNLAASYRKNKVLYDVNFDIEAGSLTGVVGPNGAGKSTLIKTVLDLHPALTGEIEFFGLPFKKAKKENWLCSSTRFR